MLEDIRHDFQGVMVRRRREHRQMNDAWLLGLAHRVEQADIAGDPRNRLDARKLARIVSEASGADAF